jgi:hypothetical protein
MNFREKLLMRIENARYAVGRYEAAAKKRLESLPEDYRGEIKQGNHIDVLYLTYNSNKAGAFGLQVELEALLRDYDKCHSNPAMGIGEAILAEKISVIKRQKPIKDVELEPDHKL